VKRWLPWLLVHALAASSSGCTMLGVERPAEWSGGVTPRGEAGAKYSWPTTAEENPAQMRLISQSSDRGTTITVYQRSDLPDDKSTRVWAWIRVQSASQGYLGAIDASFTDLSGVVSEIDEYTRSGQGSLGPSGWVWREAFASLPHSLRGEVYLRIRSIRRNVMCCTGIAQGMFLPIHVPADANKPGLLMGRAE
jgi:hypothetical protein